MTSYVSRFALYAKTWQNLAKSISETTEVLSATVVELFGVAPIKIPAGLTLFAKRMPSVSLPWPHDGDAKSVDTTGASLLG